MKLSILAVAAGFVVLPVIAHAQTKDTTAMGKDTTMSTMKMGKDTTMSTMNMSDTTTAAGRRAAARARRRAAAAARASAGSSTKAAGDTNAVRTTTSDGTSCPRGCPTSKGAAGLSGVQFLALQQELRDRGCGNSSVTGVYDGATRRAVAVCAKRLSVAATAPAVLVAFNIGFSESDIGAKPTG